MQSIQELEAMCSDEAMGVVWDEETGCSFFPDGSSAVVCTNNALQIIKRLGRGSVYGWREGTNSKASVLPPWSGHDFAVIDDRYLVDPWALNVWGSVERAVLDLRSPIDAAEVRVLYGNPKSWLRLDGMAWVEPDLLKLKMA